jgi:hypothetical protein
MQRLTGINTEWKKKPCGLLSFALELRNNKKKRLAGGIVESPDE